jgi:reactive intermediate/imine deaminase
MTRIACTLAALTAAGLLPGLTACESTSASREPVEFHTTAGSTGFPFSPAVRLGDTLYLSGAIGTDPATNKLVPGGVVPEARQTLTNIRTALEAYGSSMAEVVKCTVFLADMSEWSTFNGVYKEFFKPPYPARSALGASGLALGARVEVECIAHVAAPR